MSEPTRSRRHRTRTRDWSRARSRARSGRDPHTTSTMPLAFDRTVYWMENQLHRDSPTHRRPCDPDCAAVRSSVDPSEHLPQVCMRGTYRTVAMITYRQPLSRSPSGWLNDTAFLEHTSHSRHVARIPLSNRLGERRGVKEHIIHSCHAARIPLSDWLVERMCILEHTQQFCNVTGIPRANRLVERHGTTEHIIHSGHAPLVSHVPI